MFSHFRESYRGFAEMCCFSTVAENYLKVESHFQHLPPKVESVLSTNSFLVIQLRHL